MWVRLRILHDESSWRTPPAKRLHELADKFQKCVDLACSAFTQRRLQLGECLLDGVEVGRVGGQILQFRTHGLDRLANTNNLMGAQVVHKIRCRLCAAWVRGLAPHRRETTARLSRHRWYRVPSSDRRAGRRPALAFSSDRAAHWRQGAYRKENARSAGPSSL